MAYADEAVGRSPTRVILAVVLVIIGILAIVAGVLYLTEPAHSLPAILGNIPKPKRGWNQHRSLRGPVALAVGAVLLVVGLFTGFWRGRERY